MDAKRSTRQISFALISMLAVSAGTGCVKRRYTIRTDPPGALVYVNGEEIGTTPVSKSYTFYADREIILVADGYKTEKVLEPFAAPWWDNDLTDFFSENLLPVTLRDEREFDYKLVPFANPAPEEVLNRAQALRQLGQAPAPVPRRTFLQWLGITPP